MPTKQDQILELIKQIWEEDQMLVTEITVNWVDVSSLDKTAYVLNSANFRQDRPAFQIGV